MPPVRRTQNPAGRCWQWTHSWMVRGSKPGAIVVTGSFRRRWRPRGVSRPTSGTRSPPARKPAARAWPRSGWPVGRTGRGRSTGGCEQAAADACSSRVAAAAGRPSAAGTVTPGAGRGLAGRARSARERQIRRMQFMTTSSWIDRVAPSSGLAAASLAKTRAARPMARIGFMTIPRAHGWGSPAKTGCCHCWPGRGWTPRGIGHRTACRTAHRICGLRSPAAGRRPGEGVAGGGGVRRQPGPSGGPGGRAGWPLLGWLESCDGPGGGVSVVFGQVTFRPVRLPRRPGW